MSLANGKKSHILISNELENEIERLTQELKPNRVVVFLRDEFKIDDAKEVIAEAYKSESQTKYIVLAAKNFNKISQNSLLKVLEEPPKNIEFIIISHTKSNLLATVRSRLPIVKGNVFYSVKDIDMTLLKVDYAQIFSFLKDNSRIGKNEAKELVEALYHRVTVVDKLVLSNAQLDNFDRAYRLLELNSRPQSVLAQLLMGFVN